MGKSCCNIESGKSQASECLNKFLGLLANRNRWRICCLLKKGELCVCKIEKALNLPQNLVSHHLAKLKSMSIVEERREKTFIYYRLNRKELKGSIKLFSSLVE